MRPALFALALSVVTNSGCMQVAFGDSCGQREPRQATVSTEGISGVRIVALAGELVVKGHAGRSEAAIDGMACASNAAGLESIRLVAERRGSLLWIESEIPNQAMNWQQMQLDLTIDLPDSLPVEISDRSGDVEIRGIASLKLDDRSGEIGVFDVSGAVVIDDNSGDVRIERVSGDVTVGDRSGDIEIREVGGTVRISDRSGDIDVDGVKGDFLIEHDGGGDVDYRNVDGQVKVPKR